MPPNQQNPYDFITQAPQKKRASFLGGGNSQKSRFLRVAVVGLFVIIGGIIVLSIISNAGKASTETAYKLAAAQLDILDITNLGKTGLRDGALLNQSATTNSVITSQNFETNKYIVKIDGKANNKKIELYRVSTYKKSLDDAQKNGNYDTVYTALLANRLDEYRGKLQAVYNSSSDVTSKKKFAEFYQQLNIIAPAPTTK